jgi:hypothetical protein
MTANVAIDASALENFIGRLLPIERKPHRDGTADSIQQYASARAWHSIGARQTASSQPMSLGLGAPAAF